MSKHILAAAAVLLTVPAMTHAQGAPAGHFQEAGVDYVYTVEAKGDDLILRGNANGGLSKFELLVSKAGVNGMFDGQPVHISQRELDLSSLKLAQR